MFRVCHAFLSVHCNLLVTCWEMAGHLTLLYVMFYCACFTFPCAVLGQVWYLIVSIPELCLLTYLNSLFYHLEYLLGKKNSTRQHRRRAWISEIISLFDLFLCHFCSMTIVWQCLTWCRLKPNAGLHLVCPYYRNTQVVGNINYIKIKSSSSGLKC